MIHMDMSLSVHSKCFKTISWCVPFMFHYTDYHASAIIALYMAAVWISFRFFRSKDVKTRFLMYYNV